MPEKRVVITGIGPLGSTGTGKEEFWKGLLNRETNVRTEKYVLDGQVWAEFPVHKLKGFEISRFGIDKAKLEDIKDWKEGEEDLDLNYLLAAVKLALDDSKIEYAIEDNGLSLVLAHENIGLMPFGYKLSHLAYDLLIGKDKKDISRKDFFERFYSKFLKSGYDIQAFANLFHVARTFNIRNYSLFINNACASGLYAFEAAAQIIKNNQAKAVVIAASDHPEIYKYLWFKELGIYAEDGKVKPFCLDASGLVFGEGGAGVVLEEFEAAKKRGAHIYSEYLGGGFDLEGWKITVPQIGNDSYKKAILKALDQSKVKKSEIDLLCPHGVGSKPIDYYEANAITDIFGQNTHKPFITTYKPYVGHNLGSSALLEAVIMLLSLEKNEVLPTLNQRNPDPNLNLRLVTEKQSKPIKTAMKVCCAFAGFNSAAVFRKI